MPRQLRVQFPGAIYHVMSCGDRRENIFLDDVDRHDFLKTMVEASHDGYFKTVCDYVHLNPVRARLLKPEDSFAAYPWSSLNWYAAAPEHRPPWICVNRLLGAHGIAQDTAAGRAEFQVRMEARRAEEIDEDTLRKETTLTVKEIAARVCLGTSKSANGKLHRFMQSDRQFQPAIRPPMIQVGI